MSHCTLISVLPSNVLQKYWAFKQDRRKSFFRKFCIYQITRRHIPEDNHRYEKQKSTLFYATQTSQNSRRQKGDMNLVPR